MLLGNRSLNTQKSSGAETSTQPKRRIKGKPNEKRAGEMAAEATYWNRRLRLHH